MALLVCSCGNEVIAHKGTTVSTYAEGSTPIVCGKCSAVVATFENFTIADSEENVVEHTALIHTLRNQVMCGRGHGQYAGTSMIKMSMVPVDGQPQGTMSCCLCSHLALRIPEGYKIIVTVPDETERAPFTLPDDIPTIRQMFTTPPPNAR